MQYEKHLSTDFSLIANSYGPIGSMSYYGAVDWSQNNIVFPLTTGQNIITPLIIGSQIKALGEVCVERYPDGYTDKSWNASACSASGERMAIADIPGRLYTSSDYGVTWVERQPAGNSDALWSSISMSSSGDTILVLDAYGHIYISYNYGASWESIKPAGDRHDVWRSSSVNSDGEYQIVCTFYTLVSPVYPGRIYTSSNHGATWTERRPLGDVDKRWVSVKVSLDGSMMIAASETDYVYISTNHGSTWSEHKPGGDGVKDWRWVDCSTDGRCILATGVAGLYFSGDYGNTWAEFRPVPASDDYYPCAISSDGHAWFVANYRSRLWRSNNFGVSWDEIRPAGDRNVDMAAIAINSDGSRALLGSYAGTELTVGRVYTYTSQMGGIVEKETSISSSASISGFSAGEMLTSIVELLVLEASLAADYVAEIVGKALKSATSVWNGFSGSTTKRPTRLLTSIYGGAQWAASQTKRTGKSILSGLSLMAGSIKKFSSRSWSAAWGAFSGILDTVTGVVLFTSLSASWNGFSHSMSKKIGKANSAAWNLFSAAVLKRCAKAIHASMGVFDAIIHKLIKRVASSSWNVFAGVLSRYTGFKPASTASEILDQALIRLNELSKSSPVHWTRDELVVYLNDAIHELNLISSDIQTTISVSINSSSEVYDLPSGVIAPISVRVGNKYLTRETIEGLDKEADWESSTYIKQNPRTWAPLGLYKIAIAPKPSSTKTLSVEVLNQHTTVTDSANALPTRSEYDRALEDYIVSRALFKEGGAEFQQGIEMYNNFIEAAQQLAGKNMARTIPMWDIKEVKTSETTLMEQSEYNRDKN